jgi:hypothetical protein
MTTPAAAWINANMTRADRMQETIATIAAIQSLWPY